MTIVHVPPSLFTNQNTPIFNQMLRWNLWWDIPMKWRGAVVWCSCLQERSDTEGRLYVILPSKQCEDWPAECSQHLQRLEQADIVSKEEGNLLRVGDCYITNTMAIAFQFQLDQKWNAVVAWDEGRHRHTKGNPNKRWTSLFEWLGGELLQCPRRAVGGWRIMAEVVLR